MSDALGRQFEEYRVSPQEIGYLPMRDFPGRLGDLRFSPGGQDDLKVQEIKKSAATEGIREPVEIRAHGTAYLHDGHHRYVAARELGIDLPVRRYS